jgi:AraC family cel operon transcriptional repressor
LLPVDVLLSYIDMIEILHWRSIAPDAAFHVARWWKTPTDPTRLHTHDFAEVFWVDAGTGIQSGPSGRQALQAGDIVFIRPTDAHALESAGRMQFTNVAFPVDTYDWLRHRYPTPWTDEPKPAIQHLEPGQLQRLTRAAEELFSAPRTRLSIERFLLDLLHMLTRQPLPALPAGAPDWFRRACVEIATPENFRLGAPAFARLAGRSAEHVARVTRDLLHETPSAVVNRVRLQHAARQLALTDAKIVDIALDCGLTNLSHFYRLFRRQFGATPQAYRQQQRGLA